MHKFKTTLIITVLNEEKTIRPFLVSVFKQTKLPDEIIIVDGGSTDKTIQEISEFKIPNAINAPDIKLVFKKGNRSVGRNEAIERSSSEIILCSDAGCILDKNWVKNIIKPFQNGKTDVVAGYYKGKASSVFQKSLIPYVLVMQDRIDKSKFLPATRSMAFKKSAWGKAGAFDEKLSHNEDYAFANKLKRIGLNISFADNAIAYWIPRSNILSSFKMFFRFALGDIQANILRPKVGFIFLRYIVGIVFLILCFFERSIYWWMVLLCGILLYLFWSVLKNYKYVKEINAIIYLPVLQVTSDVAVMSGTLLGLIQKLNTVLVKKYYNST